jgi:hypothetical protein
MARPTKFTPEVTETILKAIQIGATYKDASEAAGVDYTTFQGWMTKGQQQARGEFSTFFKAVRKAEAQARLNYLTTIAQAAAKGDWKAAEAYLKRRDRANWGDNVDVTTGGQSVKVEFDYGKLIAGITPRPAEDSNAPSENEGNLHGQTMGKNDAGGDTGT